MKIGVIGGGSIGLLLTSYFMQTHHVSLYVRRQAQIEALEEHGLRLDVESRSKGIITPIVKHIDHLWDNSGHDCIFICVKQPQLSFVYEQLKELQSNIPLIFLQNGMGHVDMIEKLNLDTYVGVVEHGAKRMSDYQVNHLGKGRIVLAPYHGKGNTLQQLVTSLDMDEFPVLIEDNWEQLLHEKLLVNAVINPLTALFDIPNGEIIENEHIRKLAQQLCHEISVALQLNPSTSWHRIQAIASKTKHNTSSMRADLLANRETEIQAINGHIVRKHPTLHLNNWMYQIILALTERGRKQHAR